MNALRSSVVTREKLRCSRLVLIILQKSYYVELVCLRSAWLVFV